MGKKIFALAILRVFSSLPAFGFIISFVDFEVFDPMCGYLSETSWISINSTRTLNSWLAISVFITLQVQAVWPPLYHNLSPAIHRMSALLDSKSELWALLPLLPWPTIWESNIFHLVYSTYRQSFQLLSGFEVVSKAQRSCRDRAWANNITLHIHPAHCWRGKAAIAARPPSCILIHHHKCLNGKASIAERPPLAPTYFLSAISSIFCPLYLLGRPRRDESTSDSDPK